MKYESSLIAVKDIKRAVKFYQEILEQRVISDFGTNVSFKAGFALQEGFDNLIGIIESEMKNKSNSFELYFEEEEIEKFIEKIKKIDDIEILHGIKEYPWGQRVIRFYDFDKNLIEVGEPMEFVIKRFLKSGMTPEDVSKKSMMPLKFINHCLKNLDK